MSKQATPSVDTYKEIIQQAFAKHYTEGSDVWSDDQSLVVATQLALQTVSAELGHTDLHLLDIGCGNGRHCLTLPIDIASYTGIDLYAHQQWETLSDSSPFVTRFVHGDFVAWANQEKQPYDLILDNGCFHHQHPDEHVPYLQLVQSLLAPHGFFSLVVWAEVFKEGNIDDYGRYHFFFSAESITELMESVSFEVFQITESKALIGKTQLQVIARKK